MKSARSDANQPEIVAALRAVGATVQHLHRVGQGCPDLLVSHDGAMYLIEIKDGSLPPSARRLTAAQVKWHRNWQSPVHVVNNVTEALAVLGLRAVEAV